MTDHDPLRAALRGKADELGPDHLLTLDDVKGRARGIRRRRVAVSGLAAAAVLAVAVPVGLALGPDVTGRPDSGPAVTTSATPTPSETPPPSTTVDPTAPPVVGGPVQVVLTTQVQARGGEPQIPYLFDGAINLPDGSQVPVAADYTQVAPLGDGWVAVRSGSVDLLDSSGAVTESHPAAGSLAVSADGSIVVYATPEGVMTSLTADGPALTLNSAADARPGSSPAGVLGSGTCKEGGGADGTGGCVVYYNVRGERTEAYYASSHGITDAAYGLLLVGGVASDGRVAGVTEVSDTGSCSVLLDPDAAPLWRTCDYTLGAFSPDGRYVLGHPAYTDGVGDGSLAILDATTGEVLVDYRSSAKAQSFLNSAVWDGGDAAGTVLATVYEKGAWSLMRMTPLGDLTNVSGGAMTGGDDVSPPLFFSARP